MRRVVVPPLEGLSPVPAGAGQRTQTGGSPLAAVPVAGGRVLQMQGQTMGTTWLVKCVAPAAVSSQSLHAAIQGQLDRVVAQMSHWEPESDLSRFNRAPPGTVVSLPDELSQVLGYCLTIARDSAGACDATAGAIVNVWGFGPGSPYRSPGFQLPSAAEVAAALGCSGWRRLKLDPVGRSAVQPGGLQLDLSSIAKGYGVDRVALHLQEGGIRSFLVEVGGELRGSGVKPDGQPWWVRLEQPAPDADAIDTVVALHGLSVATSGDYRRFFDSAGSRYSHTIDPRIGRPIVSDTASVTVLHQDCMAADALSTALMVMGREEGVTWANRRGVAALFRSRERAGDPTSPSGAGLFVTEHMTERFAGLVNG